MGIAIAVPLVLPAIASAHVTIQPGTAEGGGFSVIAVRVPNERDDASTTQLRLTLPAEQPIGSVQTTDMPGWKVSTSTRKLPQPVDVDGTKIDTVVAQVTWTSTGNAGIRPGQYKDFNLSLGPLPASGDLVFRAVQTYSDGAQVNWNEVSADKSVEPEHPAPTLAITPAAAEPVASPSASAPAAGSVTTNTAGAEAPASAAGTAQVTTSRSGPAVALSTAALVFSLLAVALAWRRGRSTRTAVPISAARAEQDSHA
ncbi:YcnI family protein [Terrabacter sp. BE26]|uniref:YcnI family copper-binding membrane protein n=1 Tax=Terrabacter sp. BE26 TaxID=2898152 RepID=UPI0035BE9B27